MRFVSFNNLYLLVVEIFVINMPFVFDFLIKNDKFE